MNGFLSNIYIIEYFKRLFKKENIGTIIFLILNMGLYVLLLGGTESPEMIPIGIGLFFVSVIIALSPIGEFVLRMQAGCKSVKKMAKKNPELANRLQPLFDEVYARAKAEDPTISNKVQMFVSKDMQPNAFATGRRTVCVTQGLLSLPDEQIKGILAHEFGHIAHKDTDTLLVVMVSNMLLSVIFFVYRFIINIALAVVEDSDNIFGSLGAFIGRLLVDLILVGLMRLWTKFGVLLCMHSSRRNEYAADKFACEIGYQNDIYNALECIAGDCVKPEGFFASISSSHPDTPSRLEKIAAWTDAEPRTTAVSGIPGIDMKAVSASLGNMVQGGKAQMQNLIGKIPGKKQNPANVAQIPQQQNYSETYNGMAAAVPAGATQAPYALYEQVFAQAADGKRYAGQVMGMQNGYADIAFANGAREWVLLSGLSKASVLRTNAQVEANWYGQGNYYPCVVSSIQGNQVVVTYGDGQTETTTTAAIRF